MRRFRLCSLTAAGALAVGTLLLSAPAANAGMTFHDGCFALKGVDFTQNGVEVCQLRDDYNNQFNVPNPPLQVAPGVPRAPVAGS
jgi:hypothetical protein